MRTAILYKAHTGYCTEKNCPTPGNSLVLLEGKKRRFYLWVGKLCMHASSCTVKQELMRLLMYVYTTLHWLATPLCSKLTSTVYMLASFSYIYQAQYLFTFLHIS